jgi:hypothetical protein
MARKKRQVKRKADPVFVSASGISPTGLAISNFTGQSPYTPIAADSSGEYRFGRYELTSYNRFKFYDELVKLSPIVAKNVIETSMLISKGLELMVDDKEPDQFEEMLEKANDFKYNIELETEFQEAARLIITNGTHIIYPHEADEEQKTKGKEGIVRLEVLDMAYTTIIPEGYEPVSDESKFNTATGKLSDETLKEFGKLRGPAYKVVFMEARGKDHMRDFLAEEVVIMRIFNTSNEFTDILWRQTVGVYGRSVLEPVINPTRMLENLLYNYEKAVERYGNLKLHIDYSVLSDMIKEGNIDPEGAAKVLALLGNQIKNMHANEDILTAGVTINAIEGSTSMDIVKTKESIEKNIANGLFGNESQQGTSGSTFASSYVAESRRVIVLETIRRVLKYAFEKILHRHLVMLGYPEKDAKKVIIKFDPIIKPEVAAADIIKLREMGLINDEILYDEMGINAKPLTEEQKKKLKEEMVADTEEKAKAEAAGQPMKPTADEYQKSKLDNKTPGGKAGVKGGA